ncbi:hypothetical protein DFS34DRAFT_635541 [Phlyctochytrium arcticum]|nr:hypothetical protein DFS34DRAFT_635541 [Phlyctochytrium arcticum]
MFRALCTASCRRSPISSTGQKLRSPHTPHILPLIQSRSRPTTSTFHTSSTPNAEHVGHSSGHSTNMVKVLNDLSKNPKAMAIFRAIQNNPQLLNEVQALGMVLQQKGYIHPSNPMKQPGPLIMVKLFADADIRNRMLTVAKLLTAAGALDSNGKPVDMANMMQLMMGANSPPPPPEPQQHIEESSHKRNSTTKSIKSEESAIDKLKGFFKK